MHSLPGIPGRPDFYEHLAGDSATAGSFIDYCQFNRDMLILSKKELCAEPPEEIRRINDECFRMILEMSATILAAGGVVSLLSAMRATLADGCPARRTPAITTNMTRKVWRDFSLAQETAAEVPKMSTRRAGRENTSE